MASLNDKVRAERNRIMSTQPTPGGGVIGQTQHDGPRGGTPVAQPAPKPPVGAMTPADQLFMNSGQARQAGAIGAGLNLAGNAGLNNLEAQLTAKPGTSAVQNLQNSGPVGNTGFDNQSANGMTKALTMGKQRVAGATTGAQTAALGGALPGQAGLYQRPQNTPFAGGAGQGSIDEVDAALTGYDPRFEVPGTGQMGQLAGRGQMGALPGTVQGGALPGNAQMGALPGATDRDLQTGMLDRVLGYNPQTASLAEAQLRDATQQNLSQSLAMARSARGGPAAQAQALRMAQAEGAATMSQQGRDLAMLRAKEEDTAKQRELDALGLGGELSSSIRGSDVLERQQNVGAITDALNADVTQRGQTISSLDNALNAGVTQRGQTIDAAIAERNAGVSERGQESQMLQTERNAGVSERGQTIQANSDQNRAELDALLGRKDLAVAERQAGVQERGQTLDAALGAENVKQARDAVAASSLSEAEKTEAQLLIARAQLGYQLTPEEQLKFMKIQDSLNEPSTLQKVLGIGQAIGNTGISAYQALKNPAQNAAR